MSLIFPPSLTEASIVWGLPRDIITHKSASGHVSEITRGIPERTATIKMPPLQDEALAIFSAFLEEASGSTRFYLPYSQACRGSFDDTELLTNGTFEGTTGWTASNAVLTEGSRLLKVANNSAAEGYAYQTVSLTAGDVVCLIVDYVGGDNAEVEIYDVTGLAVLASDTATAAERMIVSAVAVNTGNHEIRLKVNTAISGNVAYYSFASSSECVLISGASQTGTTLTVDGAPISTNGLLKRGDMFSVMVSSVPSMHRLTRDFDTNSSGAGTLYFEPALPGSPADNAAVVILGPFCRMYIPNHTSEVGLRPPMLGDFAFECREDVSR